MRGVCRSTHTEVVLAILEDVMRTALLVLLAVASLDLRTAGQEVATQAGTPISMGPVTTNDVVSFRINNQKSLSDANVMPVRLRVDSTALSASFTTLVPPRTCVRVTGITATGAGYRCETKLPSAVVTRLNVRGTHRLYAFTFDGNCCESAASLPWTVVMP